MAIKKIKKLTLLLGVALTLLAPLIGASAVFTGRASAVIAPATDSGSLAPVNSASISDQVKSFVYTRAIAYCLRFANNLTVSASDASAYRWFQGDGKVGLGYLGNNGSNTWVKCTDLNKYGNLKDAATLWGFSDGITALCNMGFVRQGAGDSQSVNDCIGGGGFSGAGFVEKGTTTTYAGRMSSTGYQDFLSSINSQYYGTSGSSLPSLSDDALYWYYSQNFLLSCKATVKNGATGVDKDPNLYQLIGTDGTTTTTYYSSKTNGKRGTNKDTVTTRQNDSLDDRTNLACIDLVNNANKHAASYAAAVQADPTKQPSSSNPTGGGADGVGISCGGWHWEDIATLAISWITCPIIEGAGHLAGVLEDQIDAMLYINTDQIFCENDDNPSQCSATSGSFEQAWNVVRIFALGLLGIAGLLMILSQGLGFEIFDAYTIKKTLPRILVAAIGITLSWRLLYFIVTLSNDLGVGIRSLMYAPFQGTADQLVLGGGAKALGAIFGIGGFLALGVLGGLSFILTALLAILLAFFTLVIRNVLVILLLILAPLAIAAYILPNTEKYWKIWWDWFFKALLAFPIITAIIAAGHIFAGVTSAADKSTLNSVVAFFAYFAPYFLIPAAFRMAGGALATLSGMANDRSRGAFDRLKNYRQNVRQRRAQEWRAGSLHGRAYNALGINNLGRRVNAGWRGRYGFGQQGQSIMAVDAGVQAAQALKNNPRLSQFAMTNDDGNAVLALSGGTHAGAHAAARQLFTDADGNYDEARAQQAIAAANGIGITRENTTAALRGLAQNKSRAVAAGRTDIIRDGIDRLAGNNNQLADDLVGTFAFDSRQSGRADLGGMNWGLRGGRQQFNNQVEAYAQRLAGGQPVTGEHRRQAMADLSMMDGIARTRVQDIVGGHTAGMQQAVDTAQRFLQYGDAGQRQQAATRLLEFQHNLTGASEDNERIINRALHQAGVSYEGEHGTVAQQLATIVDMDANDLTRGARIFGDEVPQGARDQGNPPTPTATGGDE